MADGYQLRRRIGLAIATISLIIPAALSFTDADALLQFKNSLKKTEALSTWVSGTPPCDKGRVVWKGVECSDDVVTGLRLESMGLDGTIDVNALMGVLGIDTINLENNSFTGTIPALNRIKSLKAIQISKNNFSGEIPDGYFVGMVSLRSIRFAENQFSGEIPWSLDQVPNLVELELQDNMFGGQIPELEQKSLTSFNVSNNRLSGEIPEYLQRFNLSSFSGNEDLCGFNIKKHCKAGKHGKQSESVDEVIERMIMMGGAGLLALVVLALVLIKSEDRRITYNFTERSVNNRLKSTVASTLEDGRREGIGGSSKRSESMKISDLVVVNDEKGLFGMSDLMKAGSETLGNEKVSGFGMSYKAVMGNGLTVVVKRMKDCNRVGKEGFEMEMRRLGRVKHPNLLSPLAYHYRRDEKLLITEYIPIGSLHNLLHGDPRIRKELNWAVRLIIIKGIARGLDYLHSIFPTSDLPHGNLKSSNVLVGSNWEPLLSEFGFDPLVNTNQACNFLFAYKAPEAANYGVITPKCDVFCLGIVILEMLTGKFPFQYMADGSKGVDVVGWVDMCIAQGRMMEVFDRDLVVNVSPISRLEMEKLLYIGADCAERNPDLRLTLEEAVRRIELIRYGGSQDYRPPFSSDSIALTILEPFNSGRNGSQRSFDNASDCFGDGGSRRHGKTKQQTKDTHIINLSSRLKQEGYAANQATEQKPVKVMVLNDCTIHHNMYGLQLPDMD